MIETRTLGGNSAVECYFGAATALFAALPMIAFLRDPEPGCRRC